ncbi:protein translocase subunit [Onygenales sp. PD_10]|nr:protein translocase subunit [Onygenales sp. PD_10]
MSLSNPFGQPSTSTPQTSAEMKAAIISQLQQESAMTNARTLIAKLNENCFEKCIPTPGSSLSSKEQTCLTSCMEKYIQIWNATSRAYIARMGKEQQAAGMGGF